MNVDDVDRSGELELDEGYRRAGPKLARFRRRLGSASGASVDRLHVDADHGVEQAHEAVWSPLEAVGDRAVFEIGVDQRGTFGGPGHGEGVTAINVAAQAGQREAVTTLLELGPDPLIQDKLHGGTARGWARVGGDPELADVLP